MTKWIDVWTKGVELAHTQEPKTDLDYKIIKDLHPEKELGDADPFDKIWISCVKTALMGKSPSSAFEFWQEQGWLKHAIPELSKMWTLIQPEEFHPEIDVGIHAMMVIDRSAHHKLPLVSRMACLFHDFGKSLTPAGEKHHFKHEATGIPLIKNYIKNWGISNDDADIILTMTKHHGEIHRVYENSAKGVIRLIEKTKLNSSSKERISLILCATLCDDQGRKNMFNVQPRGTLAMLHILSELRIREKDINAEIEKQLKEREMAGLSYGSQPYSNEKKENLSKDIRQKITINIVQTILTELKEDKICTKNATTTKKCNTSKKLK